MDEKKDERVKESSFKNQSENSKANKLKKLWKLIKASPLQMAIRLDQSTVDSEGEVCYPDNSASCACKYHKKIKSQKKISW